jgi:hypothetical protein
MVHQHRASLLLHHGQQQSKGGGRDTLLLTLAAFAFVSCLLLLLNGSAFSTAMDDLLQQLGTMRHHLLRPHCETHQRRTRGDIRMVRAGLRWLRRLQRLEVPYKQDMWRSCPSSCGVAFWSNLTLSSSSFNPTSSS